MRGGDVPQGDRAIPAGSSINLRRAAEVRPCCKRIRMAPSPLQSGTIQAASMVQVVGRSCAKHASCQAYNPHAEACGGPGCLLE